MTGYSFIQTVPASMLEANLLSKGILIVEDMDLSNLPKNIKRLFVIPIYIKGLDSTPCTVFAEV